VGTAGRVDCHPEAPVVSCGDGQGRSQVGRVGEGGIDHERLAPVVIPDLKSVAVWATPAIERKVAWNGKPSTVDRLVTAWRGVRKGAKRRSDQKPSRVADREPRRPGPGEPDVVGVGARCDDELVRELA